MNKLIKIIVCCACVFWVLQLQAQQKSSNLVNIKNKSTNWQVYKKAGAQSAKDLVSNKAALSLNNDDELFLINERKDEIGLRHYRYQQKYKGIPIEGAIYLMHERAGKVELSNGRLIHDLNIVTQPSISVEQAKQIALQSVECDQHEQHHTKNNTGLIETAIKKTSTVILDPQFTSSPSNYHLAYKVEVRDIHSFIFKDVFVDAHNGSILLSLDKIHHCTNIDASGPTNYSENVSFTACQTNENTYALKSLIGELGSLEIQRYGIPFSTLITDAEPTFGDTQTANEVMWASQKTFDYFFNAHQHPYPDTLTKCVVHYTKNESLTSDAFYADGVGIFFGDGDGLNYNSPTSVDIVAHELSHGLTNFTADLIYFGQPGALSESFSDIFGEMVENEIKGDNDWIIGAEVLTQQSGKKGMRSMRNPKDASMQYILPDTYFGEFWMDLPKDNEGVHYNCGVHNYWFYLLCEGGTGTNDNDYTYNVEGIGKESAAAIAYRNLTYYLTPTSHYEDAKLGSIKAAKDLFSDNSNELNQVIEAWNAVGLPDCKTSDTTALMKLARSSQFSDWREDKANSFDIPFNWKKNIPVEDWNGITINEEGCVTKIDLSNKEFIGTVSSIFGSLKQLDTLNLQNNNFVGTIPASLGNLTNLETLLLNNNALKGSLPGTFQYLKSLEHINVSNNQLEGCFEAPLDSLCRLMNANVHIDEGNGFKVSWETFCEGYACRECRLVDSLSLLKVYEATDGANWTNTWNLSEPITDWYGVTFDENDCVEGLYLSDNNLSGPIPSEMGDLYSLHYLYLDNNRLQGPMPYELININNIIKIDLSYNLLSGCYSANLDTFFIKYDDAFDSLSNQISDGNFFDASWNDFQKYKAGSCDNYLPMECRQRDSIALLALHQTTNGENWKNTWNLNESIDKWHGIQLGFDNCVTNVLLPSNNLDGFIPDQIGYLSKLRNLNFWDNNLSGIIPEKIGDLSVLSTLKLQNNQLSGKIPASLGNLESLIYLHANSNQLSGSLPKEISNMRTLRTLHLHNNQLNGSIPSNLEEITNLTKINLSKNNFTGSIPDELGNLPILESLAVFQNQLSGGLPANFSNLSKLKILSLKDNDFKGCYAPDLQNLCQQISTTNYVLVSDGNNFEASWGDFCNSNEGICISPVLPGDFNADGIVNYNDLLYWGLARGNTGPSRTFASPDWAPQNASDWTTNIKGINGKHQDANGDGLVNEADLVAFELNYGATTYNVNPLVNVERTFAFTIEVTDFAQNDFTFDLRMQSLTGSDSIDIHGLSMSLNFSDFIVDDFLIDDSRSVIPSNQLKTFYNEQTETLDISMTKIDRKNFKAKNNDVVLSIKGCIQIDDLPGDNPPAITIEGGGLLNKDGDFKFIDNTTLLPYFLTDENEGSFPSTIPVAVTILPHSCENLGAIYINTIEGQGLPPYTYSWSNGSETSFIDRLQAGSYQVVISDNAGRSQHLKFTVEDKQTNCFKLTNCIELLDLTTEIEDGIYRAKNIYFNGTVGNHNGVYLKASNIITLDVGTQIENITINIEDCE